MQLHQEPLKKQSKIPDGLYKCPKCGEYKGKVQEKDLNWEGSSREKTGPTSEEYLTVSCLCDGILCPRCHKNQMHRPVSNCYEEELNKVLHYSALIGWGGCQECINEHK